MSTTVRLPSGAIATRYPGGPGGADRYAIRHTAHGPETILTPDDVAALHDFKLAASVPAYCIGCGHAHVGGDHANPTVSLGTNGKPIELHVTAAAGAPSCRTWEESDDE